MLTGKNLVAKTATTLNNFKIDDPSISFKRTVRGLPFSTSMHVMTNLLTSLPLVRTYAHLGYPPSPPSPHPSLRI